MTSSFSLRSLGWAPSLFPPPFPFFADSGVFIVNREELVGRRAWSQTTETLIVSNTPDRTNNLTRQYYNDKVVYLFVFRSPYPPRLTLLQEPEETEFISFLAGWTRQILSHDFKGGKTCDPSCFGG